MTTDINIFTDLHRNANQAAVGDSVYNMGPQG